jgi:glutathione synthase/RimK-type ligase-like ATP-grasp enzyme
MRAVVNITSPGTNWRVFEKEELESAFGPVIDLSLGDIESTKEVAAIATKDTVIFWRLNSDEITKKELSLAMAQRSILKGLKMINDPSGHLHIHAKESAFQVWEENGINTPSFQVINEKQEIVLDFPYLIRVNNQVTGKDSFLVRDKVELDRAWPILLSSYYASVRSKPFTKMIAVEFIDAKKEEGKYNLSYRIIVAGDKVVTGYARLSEATDWVAITGKFKKSMGSLFLKYQERCNDMINRNHDKIVSAVKSLGMNLQGVDIIEDQSGKIYFLECQPGFSTGYSHWPPPFYNPYQSELVEFILENRDQFASRCPIYHDYWLDKRKLFKEVFKSIKEEENE